MIFIGYSEE